MNPIAVPTVKVHMSSRKSTSLAVTLMLLLGLLVVSATAAGEDRAAGDWVQASTGLPTSGTYFGVSFGDVNNDGKLDIVGASDGEGVRVFLGDGAGSWSSVSTHPASNGGYGDLALGDYDAVARSAADPGLGACRVWQEHLDQLLVGIGRLPNCLALSG